VNKAHAVGETELAGQLARHLDGGGREIQADYLRATLRQC
jgi:hypothetical protein